MRNLRKAALVAAMVGSLGLFGGGVASATGVDGPTTPVFCHQENDVNEETTQIGLVNLSNSPLALLGGSNSSSNSTAQQNICSGGDTVGVNTSESGDGGDGLLGGLLGGLGL
jgi:hypothetical protein